VIGGKTPMEFCSREAAQDYGSLRIFGCHAYYLIKKDKLNPRATTKVFLVFKRGVKVYKI